MLDEFAESADGQVACGECPDDGQFEQGEGYGHADVEDVPEQTGPVGRADGHAREHAEDEDGGDQERGAPTIEPFAYIDKPSCRGVEDADDGVVCCHGSVLSGVVVPSVVLFTSGCGRVWRLRRVGVTTPDP